jgi:uncharacterized protein HemX
LACWLLSAALSLPCSPAFSDVVLTDAEAAELDSILATLETRSAEQAERLTRLDATLATAQRELQTARDSLAAAVRSSEEREREVRRLTAERDGWRVAVAVTGAAGLIAVLIAVLAK